jgi:hypothetical protein
MRSTVRCLGRGVGLVLGVLAATAAVHAQADRWVRPAAPPPPRESSDVHQMTILNGANRTVHYFANGNVSPGDSTTLKDLERAENELSYAQNLEALKREYVHSERILEKERRYVQQMLYGRSVSSSAPNPFAFSTGFGGRFGLVGNGYPFGFPYNYGGYGYGGFGAMIGGGSVSETDNLAYGTGYEGPIKEAVAQTISRQATPEYTAAVYRNYGAALARAANTPVLRDSLALGKPKGRPEIGEAAYGQTIPGGPTFQAGRPVTLTLKGGGTLEGTVVGEDPDWVAVETSNSIVNVRKAEVVKGEQKKPGGKEKEPAPKK